MLHCPFSNGDRKKTKPQLLLPGAQRSALRFNKPWMEWNRFRWLRDILIEGRMEHSNINKHMDLYHGALGFIEFAAGNCLLPTSIHDDLALNRMLSNKMPRNSHQNRCPWCYIVHECSGEYQSTRKKKVRQNIWLEWVRGCKRNPHL